MRVVAVLVQRIGQVIGVEPMIARLPVFAAIAADVDAADADANRLMWRLSRGSTWMATVPG